MTMTTQEILAEVGIFQYNTDIPAQRIPADGICQCKKEWGYSSTIGIFQYNISTH
jgi:hypothetical protein